MWAFFIIIIALLAISRIFSSHASNPLAVHPNNSSCIVGFAPQDPTHHFGAFQVSGIASFPSRISPPGTTVMQDPTTVPNPVLSTMEVFATRTQQLPKRPALQHLECRQPRTSVSQRDSPHPSPPVLARKTIGTTSGTAEPPQVQPQLCRSDPQAILHSTRTSTCGASTSRDLEQNHVSIIVEPCVASRKRKRAHQYIVSYSEVQEVDHEGVTREVIVIEGTPLPSTASPATSQMDAYSMSYQPPVYSVPVRTRARAAAEALGNLSASTSTAILPPPPKKRKREVASEMPRSVKKLIMNGAPTSTTSKQWALNGAVTKDVCAHRASMSSSNLRSPARIFLPPSLPTTTLHVTTRKATISLFQTTWLRIDVLTAVHYRCRVHLCCFGRTKSLPILARHCRMIPI